MPVEKKTEKLEWILLISNIFHLFSDAGIPLVRQLQKKNSYIFLGFNF